MFEVNGNAVESILCFVCTAPSTGPRIVGTISLSSADSLADVRERLCIAACQYKGVSCSAVHAFDFSSHFRFIRNSTALIPISEEKSSIARDCLPRLPSRGVKFSSAILRAWKHVLNTDADIPLFSKWKSSKEQVSSLLCMLFVSQVEISPLEVTSERAFLERVSLSPQICSFGRPFEPSVGWRNALTQYNVNVTDCFGLSLLHETIITDELVAFEQILQIGGVQLNIIDNRGNAPLHLAIILKDREKYANALLEAGADPLAPNFSGNTPLHLSYLCKRPIVQGTLCERLRLSALTDISSILDLQNNCGISIRDLFLSSVSFVELLQKGTREAVHSFCTHFLYESDSARHLLSQWNGNSALHVAAEGGNIDVLRYLLSRGDNNLAWERNYRHETPLHIASRLGYIQCVDILVERFPYHLSMVDIGGNTPFLSAIKSKSIDMITHMYTCYTVEQLQLHIRDAGGWCAFHLLCGLGLFDVAENILMSHDFSFKDETPSNHFCCWNNGESTETIIFNRLLKKKAGISRNLNIRRFPKAQILDGEKYLLRNRALHFRKDLGNESLMYSAIVAANREKDKDWSHFLLLLCKRGGMRNSEDCANLFVYLITKRRDALLNEILSNYHRFRIEYSMIKELKYQNALLCMFCARGDSYGIRWCVESKFGGIFSGVFDDIRTPQDSPLHISISLGDAAAVDFLLANHFDANMEPIDHPVCPLSWALQHSSLSQSNIVESLIRNGSRIVRERVDSSTWNAIEEAALLHNENVVRGLVGYNASGVTSALESVLQKAAYNELLQVRNRRSENGHKVLCRICVFLAKHVNWYNSNIHPYELICLAAHARFFDVLEILLDSLLRNPTSLSDTPFSLSIHPPLPPPIEREIIIPKTTIPVGCKNCGKRRILYSPKKTTYTRYCRRFFSFSVQPTIQRGRIKIEQLPHRLVRRDAFSFLAESGRVDLIQLLFELTFRPWEGGDRRGWSPADYAICGLKREAFRILVEQGIFPLCEHKESDLLLTSTIYGSLTRSAISLHNKTDITPPLVVQAMLANGVDDLVIMSYSRNILGTFVDNSVSTPLFSIIVEECLRFSRLSLLVFFVEEYNFQIKNMTSLLFWAAITGNVKAIELLLQYGCSPTTSVTVLENMVVPSAIRKLTSKWKIVSPLFVAVAACALPTAAEMLSSPWLLSFPISSVDSMEGKDMLIALAERIKNLNSSHVEEDSIKIVRLLARCGHPYCSSKLVETACRKRYFSLIVTLIKCYGNEVVLVDLDELQKSSPSISYYGSLLYAVAVSGAVCSAFEELLGEQKDTNLVDQLSNFAKTQSKFHLAGLWSKSTNSRKCVLPTFSSLLRLCFLHGSCRAAIVFVAIGFLEFPERTICSNHPNRQLTMSFCRALFRCNHYYTSLGEKNSQIEPNSYSFIHGIVEEGDFYLLDKVIKASEKVQSSFATDILREGYRTNGPTLISLCLHHPVSLCAMMLNRVNVLAMALKASDIIAAIESRLFLNSCIHAALRSKSIKNIMDLFFSSVNLLSTTSHASFFLQNSRCRLKIGSAISVAVFTGSIEYVQFIIRVVHEQLSNEKNSGGEFDTDTVVQREEWNLRDNHLESEESTNKIRERKFKGSNMPMLSRSCSWIDYKCGLVELATVAILNAYLAKDRKHLKECEQIFIMLITSKLITMSPTELNNIAISLASMKCWEILKILIHHANDILKRQTSKKAENDNGRETGKRFFFTISDLDKSPVLKHSVGIFRHVMQASIARSAKKEIITMIARHSQRTDVENTADALGRKCWYIAVHSSYIRNSNNNKSSLSRYGCEIEEAISSLRLPVDHECCMRTGRTLLHLSAMYNRVDILKQLLDPNKIEKGNVYVDKPDNTGCTALMLAARFGHMQAAAFLLERKANPLVIDRQGFSAAMHAAASGKDDVAAFLFNFTHEKCEKESINYQSAIPTQLIHCIAKGGCEITCEALLKYSSNPVKLLYERDGSGNTALTLSRGFGHGRIVRQLVTVQSVVMSNSSSSDTKMYMETADTKDKRVLFCDASLTRYGWLSSAMRMCEKITHIQQERKASVDNVCCGHHWGSTWSLKWCAENNYLPGIRSLADRNVADNCFALHSAALRGLEEVVDLLLHLKMSNAALKASMGEIMIIGKVKKKVSPILRCSEKYFPFEIAALSGHLNCALRLLSQLSDSEMIDMILEEFNVPDKSRQTGGLLHRLAIVCHGMVLEALVRRLLTLQLDDGDMGTLLTSLFQREDESGLSVLEYTLCMGKSEGFLRCIELIRTVQRSGVQDSSSHVVLISPALLHFLPSLSPSMRVLLFDVLDMVDACRTAGFEKSRTRKHSRLSFGDVRLIGIEQLKENPHCAACTSLIFTPDHERIVLGYVMRKWKHLIRFEPKTFEVLAPSEQSMYLQWLGSSLILSIYSQLPLKRIKKINIAVRKPDADEGPFFEYKKGVVVHSLGYSAGKSGSAQILEPKEVCSFAFKSLRSKWSHDIRNICSKAKKRLRALPYPGFKRMNVEVNWDIKSSPIRGTCATEDAVYWERVINQLQTSMERCITDLECKIPTILNELNENDFEWYSSSLSIQMNDTLNQLMYCFMEEGAISRTADRKDLPFVRIPIYFSDRHRPDEAELLRSWYRYIEKEAFHIRMIYLKEQFLEKVAIIQKKGKKDTGVSVTFEVDDLNISEVDLTTLTGLMNYELPNAITTVISFSRTKKVSRNGDVSCQSIPSTYPLRYISNKFRKYFKKVIVKYCRHDQNTIPLLTKYDVDEGTINLFFNSNVAPCEYDIITTIKDELALHLKERAEQHLFAFITENQLRLRTYMPSASLRVDFDALNTRTEMNGNMPDSSDTEVRARTIQMIDQLLLAYHLLYYDQSANVFTPLLEAIRNVSKTIGPDRENSQLELQNVKEVVIQMCTDEESSISIIENRNVLVYYISLRAVGSKISLLSAQDITSQLEFNFFVGH